MTRPAENQQTVEAALGLLESALRSGEPMTGAAIRKLEQSRAALRDLVAQADAYREALRAEFLRILPDLDYETQTGAWGWEAHPWFDLLGFTDEECCEHIRALARLDGAR